MYLVSLWGLFPLLIHREHIEIVYKINYINQHAPTF